MAFQNAKREMKVAYGHSDPKCSDNEHRKSLHVMFGGSKDITSWHVIKTLRREVAAAAPAPRVALHRKWMETSISFDASHYPKSMVGTEWLPLLVSPTIANIILYNILIDGGATLNLICFASLKKLQIPMSKLQPLCPFSGVGPMLVMSRSCISILVTFKMPDNFCIESILFDIVEVNLPFNAILGRSALYQFVVVAHYGYLVLKMLPPNDVLKICGDHDAGVSVVEKLQALAAAHEATAGPVYQGPMPPSLRQHSSASRPHVQPSDNEGVRVKTIQIGADAS
jgi:hypothetical protein